MPFIDSFSALMCSINSVINTVRVCFWTLFCSFDILIPLTGAYCFIDSSFLIQFLFYCTLFISPGRPSNLYVIALNKSRYLPEMLISEMYSLKALELFPVQCWPRNCQGFHQAGPALSDHSFSFTQSTLHLSICLSVFSVCFPSPRDRQGSSPMDLLQMSGT